MERLLYVGESALRGSLADASASVAVVSRDDWTVVARIPLPCDEVYDIVVAPEALIEGVRRGFRTNPVRTAERDQLALFDAWPPPRRPGRTSCGSRSSRKGSRGLTISMRATPGPLACASSE